MIYYPLTKLQCSPTSDGAGAAIIVSQRFLDQRPDLASHAILIAGQSLVTDSPALYDTTAMNLVGAEMSIRASEAAYAEAGVRASDIKVCELHDCFSANELILLEGLGFCEKGKAHHMVRNGDITYGGKGPCRQSLRWPHKQGSPSWCHGSGAVCRARLAAAWLGQQRPSRQGRQCRVAT